MGEGIRALVEFETDDICPIVDLSASRNIRIDEVSRSVSVDPDTPTASEFTVEIASNTAPEVERRTTPDRVTPILAEENVVRYRLAHEDGISCPCECLGSAGCPVSRYIADEGTLRIEFSAADFAELQELVGRLREEYPDMTIKRLLRSPDAIKQADSTMVNTSSLTDRQLEVLETAYEMGYFDNPKGANASDIASTLGIHPSTLSEHLTLAQKKFFDQVV